MSYVTVLASHSVVPYEALRVVCQDSENNKSEKCKISRTNGDLIHVHLGPTMHFLFVECAYSQKNYQVR